MTTSTPNPFLYIFKDTIVAHVADQKGIDLSARQLGVLLTVYLENPDGGHTVRGLSSKLNVSKPAISRALDRLGEFDLVRRMEDSNDRRSILVQKTPAGNAFIRNLGKIMTAAEGKKKEAA